MAKRLQMKKGAPGLVRKPSSAMGISPAISELASSWKSWLPQVLLITILTFWIYWPALRGGFIWDDEWYITENPLLRDLAGLWKIWFQPGSWVEYYPIEETVQWLQWQSFAKETLGYHVTNVVLHIINSLLIWKLFAKLKMRLAWLGGLLFAVHPVHVESVAWISELKNTLSLPFFLLAMCYWIDFEDNKRREDYQRALFLFLAAMLCKITMAPFPVIILIYAWWKRSRVDWKDVYASGPFFLISLCLGMVTIVVGKIYLHAGHDPNEPVLLGGPLSRFVGAGLITLVYFSNVFVPVGQLLAYPKWPVDTGSPVEYIPWLALGVILWWLWIRRENWGRHALFGLLFFLTTLMPFMGFHQISYMDFTWVLDHLLYIPSIGLIALIVAGVGDLDARFGPRFHPCVFGAVGLLVAVFSVTSHVYAHLFQNDETFWSYVLRESPDDFWAHHDLGGDFLKTQHYPEALNEFEKAVALRPNFADGYYSVGLTLTKMGRDDEGREQLMHGLRIDPNNAGIYDTLGDMARHEGDYSKAEELYRHAHGLDPDDSAANVNLGDVLMRNRAPAEAIPYYQHALEVDPDQAQVRYNLGNALLQVGRLPEAVEQLQTAVDLNPRLAAARENLGSALAQSGRLGEAVPQFEAAVDLDPGYVIARNNLALALAQTGHVSESIDQFKQVLQIDPANAQARDSLAKLQQFQMQQRAPGK